MHLAFTIFHLPISHIVDSIGGCEGLREHLQKVEDIMHTGVSHLDDNTLMFKRSHVLIYI